MIIDLKKLGKILYVHPFKYPLKKKFLVIFVAGVGFE